MESRNKEIILDNSNITTNENINENAAAANETAAFSGLVEINSFDVKEPDETETPIEVKEKKVNRFVKFYRGELFTKGFKILLCIFLSTVVIYLLSRFVPVFAEFWTRYPAQWIRFLLAKLTGWIPFSLAEAIIVSLPVLAIAYLIASSVSTKKDESNKNYYRWVRPMISMILVVLIIFFAGFGPAYGRYKLSENLGLVQKDVSSTELYATSIILSQKVKEDI